MGETHQTYKSARSFMGGSQVCISVTGTLLLLSIYLLKIHMQKLYPSHVHFWFCDFATMIIFPLILHKLLWSVV